MDVLARITCLAVGTGIVLKEQCLSMAVDSAGVQRSPECILAADVKRILSP